MLIYKFDIWKLAISSFLHSRSPNSSDLNVVWDKTIIENPKYLSLDGDNTRMVDGPINGSRGEFWNRISETVRLKQKL